MFRLLLAITACCLCSARIGLVTGDCETTVLSKNAGKPQLSEFQEFAPEHASSSSGKKELYFTQTLDHFNFVDKRTWEQRYFLIGEQLTLSVYSIENRNYLSSDAKLQKQCNLL